MIKLLYFADYVAYYGFLSEFKSTSARDKLYDLITQIYECGDQTNLPKSLSMSTIASQIRFLDEEGNRLMREAESDLQNIARHVLAWEFAKKDLRKLLDAIGDDNIESMCSQNKLISKRAIRYINEFERNGIKNLRFRMFYEIADDEGGKSAPHRTPIHCLPNT